MASTITWADVWSVIKDFPVQYSIHNDESEELFKAVMEYVPENGVVVEIGVFNGRSSISLASACKNKNADYYAVDNFFLGSDPNYQDHQSSPDEFRALLGGLDLPFTLLVGDSKIVDIPTEITDRGIDFIFIDGDHSPEGVAGDTARWVPLVNSGGVVAYDDCPATVKDGGAHHGIRTAADEATGDWREVWYDGKVLIRVDD